MKLQKIILCVAIALTAFGIAIGLMDIGLYLGAAVQPVKVEIKPLPLPSIVYQPKIAEVKQNFAPPEAKASEEAIDRTGYYLIIDDNPKGFEDFEYLHISISEYDEKSEKAGSILRTGWIEAKKVFVFSWLSITGKRISLVTQSNKGVSYELDGKFVDEGEEVIVKDSDGDDYTEQVFLKGRLTKWLNGKKIAEAKVKFAFTVGC
ncbi:MAG: hypothetical protein ABJA66_11255 [Actinomycetota bacterium]